MSSSQDEQISHVASITGASPRVVRQILESTNWNTEEAIQLFYESQEAEDRDEDNDDDMEDDHNEAGPAGSAGAPSSSRPSRPPPPQSRMRTLKDLQGDSHGDESDDEDEKQDFFAGGEKSALAVQNPNNNNGGGNNSADHFNSIMNQARQNRARPGGDEEPPTRHSNFAGRAQTLGGEDAPSQVVGSPSPASRGQPLPRLTRTLHLWQDGFSVDDGPLFRFDDPQNGPTLALINQGRAPLALLGVEPGQEVDLQLNPHKDEKYVQPKRQYKAFEGSGHRLGSPTPGVAATGSAPAATSATSARSTPAAPAASAAPTMAVDESQPTVTLQIRLGDGTRLSSRFNTTHTIGDVYGFVTASSSGSASRAWVLMTTFPSKELSDKAVKLGDLAEFKRGGALVQKWA